MFKIKKIIVKTFAFGKIVISEFVKKLIYLNAHNRVYNVNNIALLVFLKSSSSLLSADLRCI